MSRERIVVVGIVSVLVLAVVMLLSGCQTVKGICGDSAWILQETADNIQTE